MRTIDADALKKKAFGKRGGLVHTSDIDAAPTIDAIPMWWITEKFLDLLNKDKELSRAAWMVRKAWLDEREAKI